MRTAISLISSQPNIKMDAPCIKNIQQLFQLGPADKIKNQKIGFLTAPGENYGSLMLSVELTIETPNGEENIYTVAKMVPPNEFLQNVFNTKVTFHNEIAFYKNIVPLLQKFQKENGVEKIIDFTPEYYGSRLNLNGECDEVDADAVLVLENLKFKNFVTLERTEGLDFNTAKLIMNNLAHLHAVSLALKLKKPNIFEKEVKPYLHGFHPDEKLQNFIKRDIAKVIDQIEALIWMKEKILVGFDKMVLQQKAREPFATIVHDDCWTNNTMVKFEGTTPVISKLLDYQLCSYGSPAKDVIFFIFTSVKEDVVLDKYDKLLKLYHETFLSILKEFQCETAMFSFEHFLEEIDFEAKNSELGHISYMLIPIFAHKKAVKSISEIKPESMEAIVENITDLHKQKFIFVISHAVKSHTVMDQIFHFLCNPITLQLNDAVAQCNQWEVQILGQGRSLFCYCFYFVRQYYFQRYTMNIHQVKNIESLIQLEADRKILKHKVKRLTAPGENYGSLMLSVDLEVETPQGTQEICTVAKMLPPNKFMQELFNTKVTFRNEIEFYKTIVPELQKFQREHDVKEVIDFAPRYYGSRLNLDNNDSKMDSEAVLVLENLKLQNYITLDSTEGLDLEVTKLVLENLANLHAVPLALKLQKPEIFERKIKPFLQHWSPIPDHYQKLKKDLTRLVEHTKELQPFKEQIVREFERQMVLKEPREPFATISHDDCWVNNALVKFNGTKPVKSKIVDYAMCSYGSPARDVIFFLFSSVKNEVLEKYYDDLVSYYYQTFRSILEELKCDTKIFSFEDFLKEIDYEAKNSQFAHVAFMLFPILADKKNVKDISEFTPDNLISEEDSDSLKKKFVFFVDQFMKRKWIYN